MIFRCSFGLRVDAAMVKTFGNVGNEMNVFCLWEE